METASQNMIFGISDIFAHVGSIIMIRITYTPQLIFSGQDVHTQGSTTPCLEVIMWQYFRFKTTAHLANKNNTSKRI